VQPDDSTTRRRILKSALKHFAHSGYAASSVQQIVGDARVSKPALYYHFSDKAGLFQALLDSVHDEQFRRIQEAAARAGNIRDQLLEILTEIFDYLHQNRELVRMSFATAFAARGELPDKLKYREKCERNFNFVHGLIKTALANGELDRRFDSLELALGFYGQLNIYVMGHLWMPRNRLDRKLAGRVVELLFAGAAAKKKGSK
jgi:AcrR family transcriptional regulator